MSALPKCRVVTVHLFRGDRGPFGKGVRQALIDHKYGRRASGPTAEECLLYAGHTGVSVDSDPKVIWGFNPDVGTTPLWQVMEDLMNHLAFPGKVTDDTNVFAKAVKKKLQVMKFDVILPEPTFLVFEKRLIAERSRSQFKYGFPNGDGDCNCATWPERLAIPLLSGSMEEFADMTAASIYPRRRLGECV